MINSLKSVSWLGRKMSTGKPLKSASFGMQCFWGAEAQFAMAPGVHRTKVGYTGGKAKSPTYRNIGDHTETVQVDYDPESISFENLLSIFWSSHDPTIPNKRQYMSAIFYHDQNQKTSAEETLQEEQKRYRTKIETQIQPAETFYDAEDYHQKYFFRSYPELFKSVGVDGQALKDSTVAAKLNGYVGGFGSLEQFEKESKNFGLNELVVDALRKIIAHAPRVRCH